jgi:hypothetical protein
VSAHLGFQRAAFANWGITPSGREFAFAEILRQTSEAVAAPNVNNVRVSSDSIFACASAAD